MMALSDKAKRRTAAASLAVAIAIPAEGLRQWALPRVQSESLPLRPFALQPAVPQFRGNAELTAPVGEALGGISDSNHSILAAIALLLRFCGPATLLAIVALVIINSFNGMTGRWLPHISQEVGEVSPLIRSEEHTSELQSHHDLVCRLLLEKKKKKKKKKNKQKIEHRDHNTKKT